MGVLLRPWFAAGKLQHVDTICPEEIPFVTDFAVYSWFWPQKIRFFLFFHPECEIITFPIPKDRV
jgi:hypothetical protein